MRSEQSDAPVLPGQHRYQVPKWSCYYATL